ncbi:MAG: DUF3461 family protein [Woeseiaceae bacterium]
MKTYPHLSEMGVLHPQQIDKYSINSIARTDILRIVYDRPKGSVLPLSRTYKFPRIQKSSVVDSGTLQTEYVLETDPAFRGALAELKEIMEAKGNNQDVASAILEELRLLEEDIALRSDYIKTLAGKIQKQ